MMALAHIHVIELGQRTSVRAAGALLSQLGAHVIAYENEQHSLSPSQMAQLMAGKIRAPWEGVAEADLEAQLADAHIVLLSSDQPLSQAERVNDLLRAHPHLHIVDIVAERDAEHFLDQLLSDVALQALSGMMETTGMPDGPPVLVDGQPLELIAGLHAMTAALASLYAGVPQRAVVNLMDCAISSHAVFVSKLTEEPDAAATRSGNRHQLASPWNIFQAKNGWLLICMASESQWQRVCELMGRAELAYQPGFDSGTARQQNIAAVEAVMQAWVQTMTVAEVSAVLLGVGIPCGAVAPVDQYPREPNMAHRGLVGMLPGGVFGIDRLFHIHAPLSNPAVPIALDGVTPGGAEGGSLAAVQAPLRGVRVVEVGQFTTAPLTGRYLAQLGAEVIKVESPDGEPMRAWMPQRHGVGTFFVVNNTGKRSVALNLKLESELDQLRQLVRTADVLIENLKPGALARMGLSVEQVHALNPRCVYCAVTGFGHDSIYPGRPAYDTVIQAMSGLMAQTRAEGVPVKTGMSAADVMGANMATGAVIAGLLARSHGAGPQFIDISMQDVAAWACHLTWNAVPAVYDTTAVVPCADGYVLVEDVALADRVRTAASTQRREELAQQFSAKVWPIRTLTEVLRMPQGVSSVLEVTDSYGDAWPVLRNPITLQRTPLVHDPVLSALGADNTTLIHQFDA